MHDQCPFRFPVLKDQIEARQRWRYLDEHCSYFESDWKPESSTKTSISEFGWFGTTNTIVCTYRDSLRMIYMLERGAETKNRILCIST